jgi:hypothetical protein
MTFTEQWNTETTETMSFSVPAGEMAYLYQGYILSRELIYDAKTGGYSWGDQARFLTNILATSATSLVDPSSK